MTKKVGIFAEVQLEWEDGTVFYKMVQLDTISNRIVHIYEDLPIIYNVVGEHITKTKDGFIKDYRDVTQSRGDENFKSFNVYLAEYNEYKTEDGEFYDHEDDSYTQADGVLKSLPFGMYTKELYIDGYPVGEGSSYGDTSRQTQKVLSDNEIVYNKEEETVPLNTLFKDWANGFGDSGYARYEEDATTTLKYDETKFIKLV